ncbi:MAG: galactose ABC transporter substrate-binding protein [Erysipelotrichaceae bacterium]|nr:galactose ABC transporter substrate-binding protein [Erysipelotrichaceae bacterium]
MKKVFTLLVSLMLALSLAACSSGTTTEETAPAEEKTEEAATETATSGEAATAGALWYQFADTFIANAKNNLDNISKADGRIKVTAADSQNDVGNQTNNMANFLNQGVDYIIINNINNAATDEIAEEITASGAVAIFANTSAPSDAEFEKNPNVYLVTSAAEQSGTIMGEALAKYWNEHPEADRNGDGKLNYVMLLGLETHYDTIVRCDYSLAALEDAGIEVESVGDHVVANYARAEAMDKVQALLANYSDDIEAVIACNDDMALGAIEALKAAGFFGDGEFIPVCGVDATEAGRAAIADGTMLCTALNNPITLGKTVYKLMTVLEAGEPLTQEAIGFDDVKVDGQKCWIQYTGITKDNLDVAEYSVDDVAID